jgi:acetyl-CoA carboxylase biotin carboxylase subunit
MIFNKVLVANRGAVAARVLRALNEMSIPSVAVYSEADAGAPYLAYASETYCIGASPAKESYLNQERILKVLQESNADAIHPGYGFLSENFKFASGVVALEKVFIGPSPKWIEAMGHKTKARELARQYGLPVGQGSEVLPPDQTKVAAAARKIGYPVLVKPAAGGGGIGMLPAYDQAQLFEAVERARSMAERGFSNPEVYLEKLLDRPRHIEIQILGDQYGSVRHLYERDCSIQRRHQKVIEEAGAPGIDREIIDSVADNVTRVMGEMQYDNIGTVEMLMGEDHSFAFLEMNTRLQVEHGVTEEVTGVDLVQSQILLSAGARLDVVLPKDISIKGHAIQARVYAEDPKRFFPSPGKLNIFRPPISKNIRVETGYAQGRDITPFYDPMIAKVIAYENTREQAILSLKEALEVFEIEGVKNNIPALLQALDSSEFKGGKIHTNTLSEIMTKNNN